MLGKFEPHVLPGYVGQDGVSFLFESSAGISTFFKIGLCGTWLILDRQCPPCLTPTKSVCRLDLRKQVQPEFPRFSKWAYVTPD